MYKSVNMYAFERDFVDMNRAEQFTYEGKEWYKLNYITTD
jgi:hypothetical protein